MYGWKQHRVPQSIEQSVGKGFAGTLSFCGLRIPRNSPPKALLKEEKEDRDSFQ